MGRLGLSHAAIVTIVLWFRLIRPRWFIGIEENSGGVEVGKENDSSKSGNKRNEQR